VNQKDNPMGWNEEQLKCLDERRCMKCKTKMIVKNKIPMFGGYVDSWGCPNKRCSSP